MSALSQPKPLHKNYHHLTTPPEPNLSSPLSQRKLSGQQQLSEISIKLDQTTKLLSTRRPHLYCLRSAKITSLQSSRSTKSHWKILRFLFGKWVVKLALMYLMIAVLISGHLVLMVPTMWLTTKSYLVTVLEFGTTVYLTLTEKAVGIAKPKDPEGWNALWNLSTGDELLVRWESSRSSSGLSFSLINQQSTDSGYNVYELLI